MDFKNEGDAIFVIGKIRNDISSSHYLAHYRKVQYSPAPYFNLDEEHLLHKAVLGLINNNSIESAHDISEGGLFITLLESAMIRNLSFNINYNGTSLRNDSFLFGEAQGRVIVTVKEDKVNEVTNFLKSIKINFKNLGSVSNDEIMVNGFSFGKTSDYANIYNTSLEKKLA